MMSLDSLLVRIREHTAVALGKAELHRHARSELAQILDWARGGSADRALVLDGPRRTGKSTLLEQTLARLRPEAGVDTWYVDFTSAEVANSGIAAVLDAIGANLDDGPRTVLLLDEPHYVEGWERQLKRAVDERRARVVVADSSSAIAQAASEAGAGRWQRLPVGPLHFPEWLALRSAYGVPKATTAHQRFVVCDEWLRRGGFPLRELLLPSADLLAAHRFLEEDITMAAVRGDAARGTNPRPIERLFAWLTRDSGSQLDKSKAAQVAQGSRPSIDNWLSRLYETGLLWEMMPWAASTPKRLRKRPKIYAADPGLVAALTPGAQLPGDPELLGRLVETACANACRCACRRHGGELGFALTGKQGGGVGGEADFVMGLAGRRHVVEAKAGDGTSNLGRFAAAARAVGAATATVAARILQRKRVDIGGVEVHVVPLPEVLVGLGRHGPEVLSWD